MKSLTDLEKIRKKTFDEISLRTNKNGKRIVVGMATCGIAAGARPVMNEFLRVLKQRNMNDVVVTMTGCIGACKLEPMVDVIDSDGTKVTYVKMTPEKVEKIVAEHIVNGKICTEYTIGAEEK